MFFITFKKEESIVQTKAKRIMRSTYLFFACFVASFLAMNTANAGITIGNVASNITGSLGNLAMLITAGSYVAGFGFAIGAILKFKAHKDNPTQIPVGTPIALIFIAAALIFLPNIFGISKWEV
jgi:intracellular multiplication protein IcmD